MDDCGLLSWDLVLRATKAGRSHSRRSPPRSEEVAQTISLVHRHHQPAVVHLPHLPCDGPVPPIQESL